MAAHQFWRLTGFVTDSNALELSQAQLYDGVQLIAQAPTFSVAPTSGTAFPDTLRWDDFSMPGFALVWNLSTPVASPNLRLGAGSRADNFPKELYCQYSDDGKSWGTNNAPVNIDFPGAGLLTGAPGAVQSVAAGDPDFAKVSLLVHGDGDAGSTGIVDSSSNKKVVTVSGPTISTASPKFGTGAINFPGSGSVAFADSPDFDLPGDFTIELFAWAATAAGTGVLFSKKSNDNGGGWTQVYKNTNNTDVYLVIDTAAGGSVSFVAPSALTVGAWVHLAVTRSGNSVMLFVAGVKVFTGALTSPPSTNSDPLRLGQAGPGGNYPFVGKIDEFRITKGVARYTADFTPSVTAFPDSAAAAVTQFIPLSTTPAPQRWRTTSLFAEPIVGAEMPAFNLREVTMETSFMDAYHGGIGRISGTVAENGSPNIKVHREVLLLDEASNMVIRKTWSDPVTGVYEFVGIKEGVRYTIISYDYTTKYKAVIADNIICK